MIRVVKHWDGLPTDAVDVPSLEMLKGRQQPALTVGVLVHCGGLGLNDL